MLVVNTRLGWVAAFRGFPHSKGVMSASKVSHLESHGTLCCKDKHASPRARPETGDHGRARGARQRMQTSARPTAVHVKGV